MGLKVFIVVSGLELIAEPAPTCCAGYLIFNLLGLFINFYFPDGPLHICALLNWDELVLLKIEAVYYGGKFKVPIA